jgi:hypothetical protein
VGEGSGGRAAPDDTIWKGSERDYEHECLEQVVAIDARSVSDHGKLSVGSRG